jgi:outer membrane receptor protein involved in Fe transport
MKKILFLLLVSICTTTFAQSSKKVSITGTVIDKATNLPLELATVIILEPTSNTIISGTSTNAKGEYTLQAKLGTYTLRFEFISYKSIVLEQQVINETKKLNPIFLDEDSAQLETVEIIAEKSTVEYKLDKKVFNVGKDLISKGGSVNDVLNNVPSVNVDATGNVSLRGNSNVRILVNGKPSVLTTNNGLEQIPSNAIEKVEVSTNPSSKYDAAGTAGIINIILKKNKKGGFSSSVQLTAGSPVNNAINYNFNYKTEKFNLFSNLSHRFVRLPGTLDYYQTNYNNQQITSTSEQHTTTVRNYKMNNIYVGGDYYINNKNTLTFSYYYRGNVSNHITNYSYDYFNISQQKDSAFVTTNLYYEPQNANQIELNYVKEFDKPGKKFTANIQYDFWNDDENENITEQKIFPISSSINSIKSRDIESSKDLLFQSDYVIPIFEKSRLEMGIKGEIRRINSDYKVWSNTVLIDSLDNLMHYDEKIYGAYIQYGNKERKFQYSLGLRMEHSNTKTTDRENHFFNHKKYTDLFPTVHLTYNISDSNSLQLSYSKRITRPSFWHLNPFGGVADRNNIRFGNPDLNPMYTNSFELGTLKRWRGFTINPSVYYQRSTNIFEMITYRNSNNVIITTPINLGSEDRYGAELVTTYSPYKWWRLSGEVNFYGFNQNGTFQNTEYTSKDNAWISRLNSTIKFTNFSLQSTLNYIGARTSGQTQSKSIAWLDLGMSKDFFEDKMTLTLSANNLFNSRENNMFINGANYHIRINRNSSFRRISATLIYRFNRTKKDRDRLPD